MATDPLPPPPCSRCDGGRSDAASVALGRRSALPGVFTKLYYMVPKEQRPAILRVFDAAVAWLEQEDAEAGLLAIGLERDGEGYCTRATLALPVDLPAKVLDPRGREGIA